MSPTPEELAAQQNQQSQQSQQSQDQQQSQQPQPLVLQGDDIPETFRGKSAKEVVELLLNTSAETERLKNQLSAKDLEIEQLKPKPSLDQMSEADKKALREREFVSDPLTFIDKHYEERMRPLADEYFKGQSEVQLSIARGDRERYPDFPHLEKDIRGLMDKMPPEVRANPMAIDWAYRMARYPVLDKMLREGKVRDGLHSEGGGTPPSEPKPKVVLDDDEKSVAKRFGLSDEEYIKYSGKGTIDEF